MRTTPLPDTEPQRTEGMEEEVWDREGGAGRQEVMWGKTCALIWFSLQQLLLDHWSALCTRPALLSHSWTGTRSHCFAVCLFWHRLSLSIFPISFSSCLCFYSLGYQRSVSPSQRFHCTLCHKFLDRSIVLVGFCVGHLQLAMLYTWIPDLLQSHKSIDYKVSQKYLVSF